MSERPNPADGLGRRSTGVPTFAEPTVPLAPRPVAPGHRPIPFRTRLPGQPGPGTGPDRRSRWPAVLTTAVVVGVLGVTGGATLVARHADTHVPAPAARSRPVTTSSPVATDPDGIHFTSSHGTGRLVVRHRSWEAAGPGRLRVSVELLCTTGMVDHGPDSFQLFDADGTLVLPLPVGGGSAELAFGALGPGEQIRGDVVFGVARQVVTLVFNDDNGSVTALRIAG
ncbi:MAG: hypothetical protein AVDCRST_MAG61-133 [uncultured Friedmanniella sp.]|uniref:DUF4352 domain-containing protein n=1 Tax=uncultured Friedmanniella sp. TaxID=335381 RepID=A0A6J4JVR0_9ACTN|nr:hypothetical protein [uncultured Friedmanniella sp.]CAA9288528.1 MAG: hypothetical protein AVDCRST_MAG61-133 [uncultured Friedmanniella sp.]